MPSLASALGHGDQVAVPCALCPVPCALYPAPCTLYLAGALGHGDRVDVVRPKPIDALSAMRVLSLSAGSVHSAFVTEGGKLYTCGNAAFGRLGVQLNQSPGLMSQAPVPYDSASRFAPLKYATLPVCVPLPLGRSVRGVTAGNDHTLLVMDDGSYQVFGRGQAGQLGCGDRKDQLTLCRLAALGTASSEQLATSTSTSDQASQPPSVHLHVSEPASVASAAKQNDASHDASKIVGGRVHNRFASRC